MRKISLALAIAAALPLVAQTPQAPQFKVPRASAKSVLTQTVGFTDITITYSRPAAGGKEGLGGGVA